MLSQRTLILSAGFAAGFSGMTLELAAVRLLAPYFGTSAYVWTNVIAVTLLALAVGAWIGGRVADRGRAQRALLAALLLGGVLSFLAPLLGPALAAELLPADLRLEEAFSLLVSGSLLATLAVFGPPIALVGACSPLLVQRLVDAGSSVGRGSGGVYAISTLGSLLGTFGTTHWFVPYLGSRSTVFLAGASLFAAAGCLLLVRSRSGRSLALALVLGTVPFAVAGLAPAAAARALPDGWSRVGVERESIYQCVRIIERNLGGKSERWLQVNDGLDSFQSLREEGEIFTDTYYDPLAAMTLATRPASGRCRVLILGLGGGTLVPLLRAIHAGAGQAIELVGVEIDPVVVELAQLHLGLDPRTIDIRADMDARVALRALPGIWDAILVDAYAGQVHIPAHLCSREFFRELHERLSPGGIVALNVGALGPKDGVAGAIANTLAESFGTAWRWPVPRNRNEIVFSTRAADVDFAAWAAALEAAGEQLDAASGTRARTRVQELVAQIGTLRCPVPHAFEPNGLILSDDDARIDVLQMDALHASAGR
ncbi:MAG: fused MFS/spermidine synthase [Planctomycetes bacterium]|nr:fused MFS/spermidine synthase [Planctomycetota bacterium]